MKILRNYHDYYRIDVSYRRDDPFVPMVHESFQCSVDNDPFKLIAEMFPSYFTFCDLNVRVKLVHDVTLNVVLK